MLIKEYRVPLPLSVEEYQLAQLYSIAEASKNETGGGEGIEVLKNEPFENVPLLDGKYSSGQYTYKIFHLASKVPLIIRLLAPKGSLEVHEEAWNAYPYTKTVFTNPKWMKENFKLVIESLHLPDTGETENALELPEEKLKQRDVVHINFAHDTVPRSDYRESEDPQKFKSTKTGRGLLVDPDWKTKVQPVMTCYKVVEVEFKWFGLQGQIENFIQNSERRLFTSFHRQVFCWIDQWYGLTIDDIREIEDKTKELLDKQIKVGEVRGMKGDDE